MVINRSTRHGKIIGDFGENFFCNWLSRSGFEVTLVDHTGIDIIAYKKWSNNKEIRIGITVKSRTRTKGKESKCVDIFKNKKNDREKVNDACQAFACEAWIGVYVETEGNAYAYLTSLENYDKKYRGKTTTTKDDWKMTKHNLSKYEKDPEVKHIKIKFNTQEWNW